MYAWFVVRSAVLWLVAAAMLLAGALAIAYAIGLAIWQYVTVAQTGEALSLPAQLLFLDRAAAPAAAAAMLPYIPQLSWPWFASPQGWLGAHAVVSWVLAHVHVGVPFAAVGLLLLLAGRRLARRQHAAFAWVRMRRADRLRRRQEYRKAAAASQPQQVPG